MTRSSFQNSTQTTPVRVKVSKSTDVGGWGRGCWRVIELITFCGYLSFYRKNLNSISLCILFSLRSYGSKSLPEIAELAISFNLGYSENSFLLLPNLPHPQIPSTPCLMLTFKVKINYFLTACVTSKNTYSLHKSLTFILHAMCSQAGCKLWNTGTSHRTCHSVSCMRTMVTRTSRLPCLSTSQSKCRAIELLCW